MGFTCKSKWYNCDIVRNHSHLTLFPLSFLDIWVVCLSVHQIFLETSQHIGLEILGAHLKRGSNLVVSSKGETLPQTVVVGQRLPYKRSECRESQ